MAMPMEQRNHGFTEECRHTGIMLSGSVDLFNCLYVYISKCILMVFMSRWFEKIQLNEKILLVKAGQACCLFQHHLVLKSS